MAEATPENTSAIEEEKAELARKKAINTRKIQALQLNRAHTLELIERSESDRHRDMLNKQLEALDQELQTIQNA
jgi:hypothetical protein